MDKIINQYVELYNKKSKKNNIVYVNYKNYCFMLEYHNKCNGIICHHVQKNNRTQILQIIKKELKKIS